MLPFDDAENASVVNLVDLLRNVWGKRIICLITRVGSKICVRNHVTIRSLQSLIEEVMP